MSTYCDNPINGDSKAVIRSFFILIDLLLIIPLRYRDWDLFQNTPQTSLTHSRSPSMTPFSIASFRFNRVVID
jgi:hypothetical protein